MANSDEARIAAEEGADLVGLVGPMPSGAGVIDMDMAREIADAAPAWVTPVLLTQSDAAEAISAEVAATGVRAVQLVRHVPPEVHRKLIETFPSVRRIQVVHVETSQALELVTMYQDQVDAFLLDSGRPSHAELGGTGRIHDWSISAEFVRRTNVPVFLAGGLNPENVVHAITAVRPFGIDLCTGVRTLDRLDRAKLRAFMSAVRSVSNLAPIEVAS